MEKLTHSLDQSLLNFLSWCSPCAMGWVTNNFIKLKWIFSKATICRAAAAWRPWHVQRGWFSDNPSILQLLFLPKFTIHNKDKVLKRILQGLPISTMKNTSKSFFHQLFVIVSSDIRERICNTLTPPVTRDPISSVNISYPICSCFFLTRGWNMEHQHKGDVMNVFLSVKSKFNPMLLEKP